MTGEYKYIKNQNEKSKIYPRLAVEDVIWVMHSSDTLQKATPYEKRVSYISNIMDIKWRCFDDTLDTRPTSQFEIKHKYFAIFRVSL